MRLSTGVVRARQALQMVLAGLCGSPGVKLENWVTRQHAEKPNRPTGEMVDF